MDMILHRQSEVLKSLVQEHKEEIGFETGQCLDISGTGVKMTVSKKIQKDTLLELFIEPLIYPPVNIATLGKVLNISSANNSVKKNCSNIGIEFLAINEYDREELIKYIFKRQRELISSRKIGENYT